MRILITGGAGMIGLSVARQLSSKAEVCIIDYKEQIARVSHLIDASAKLFPASILEMAPMKDAHLNSAMKGCDIVIHLAAMLGVKRTEDDKLRCLEINGDGTKIVLDAAIKNGVKKIVYASSSEVYGEPIENPVNETSMTQGKTVYAVSKLMGEEYCKAYAQRYGIQYTILRYFNSYGINQVGQFVIPRFISNVMKGISPTVYGDGGQLRCYTYSDDTAKATVLAAFSDKANGQVFNIGRGDAPISLTDLARLAIRIGGKDLEPQMINDFSTADRSRDREIFERYSFSEKATKILGWNAEIPLEEGISRIFKHGHIFEKWADQ